jgi:hypothetical protein
VPKLLDREALLRFAPKEIFQHLDAFDEVLVTHQAHYQRLLANPFSTFRGSEIIPVIHLAGMCWEGHWTFMRLPALRFREGHRIVSPEGPSTELALQPMLRLEIITDSKLAFGANPELLRKMSETSREKGQAAAISMMNAYRREAESRIASGQTSPTMILTLPLGLGLSATAKPYLGLQYTLYQHIFGHGGGYPDDGYFYIGT